MVLIHVITSSGLQPTVSVLSGFWNRPTTRGPSAGPVMLAYPTAPEVDALLARAATGTPDVDVTADDGVRHQLWAIADYATIAALTRATTSSSRTPPGAN